MTTPQPGGPPPQDDPPQDPASDPPAADPAGDPPLGEYLTEPLSAVIFVCLIVAALCVVLAWWMDKGSWDGGRPGTPATPRGPQHESEVRKWLARKVHVA